MSILFDEFISSLLFAPDYLPDVFRWFQKQPKENGHITPTTLKKVLHVISYPCWQRFLQAIDGPCELTQEDLIAAEYKLLTETGIAHIEAVRMPWEGKKYNLIIPDTTKQMLTATFLDSIKQDKLRNSVIHLFAVAAVNAYGIIDKQSFIDLFNNYMMDMPAGQFDTSAQDVIYPTCSDELETALLPYTELRINALLMDGYLVNRMLYNGIPGEIPQFFSDVSSEKYHVFEINTFLSYVDLDYFEETPQISAFMEAMEDRFPDMEEDELSLISILFSPCYLSEWPQLIEEQLCPMLKTLSGEEQEEMVELFVGAIRSARSWRFKGFSEDEIFPEGKGREEEVREVFRVLEEC